MALTATADKPGSDTGLKDGRVVAIAGPPNAARGTIIALDRSTATRT